jgi:transposase
MPPLEREVRRGEAIDPAQTKATRAAARTAKAALPTETVEHRVPDAARTCPTCDRPARAAGAKEAVTYSFVAAHVRRRVHRRETLACACGYIVSAPPPDRVFERTPYEASLVAHLIVAKCADAIPLYRLEKQFARAGVPLSRSTMTDLFQRAGAALTPLADRIIERIAAQDVVLADETTMREQRRAKRAWLWTFVAGELVGYVYSADRSGETPARVLGGTTGTLVVDAYTGYNAVTTPAGRTRAGCLAHARRKFFDALPSAPEAQVALDAMFTVSNTTPSSSASCARRPTARFGRRARAASSTDSGSGSSSSDRTTCRRARWARRSATRSTSGRR